MEFGTKATVLANLRGKIQSASILDCHPISYRDWKLNPHGCLTALPSGNGLWAVRSSAMNEDSCSASQAGRYLTRLNVDDSGLETAISAVFESYGQPQNHEQVLLQPMLNSVIKSGVGFSHDPTTKSPYWLFNYSDGADTTRVTSGKSSELWVHSHAAPEHLRLPTWKSKLLDLGCELYKLFGSTPIDFEFAITSCFTVWLLQVRPLVLNSNPSDNSSHFSQLRDIELKLTSMMRPQPFLQGTTTAFGVMPDWNPAEIIGVKPKPLALSLYRELVTDSIWAYQRHNYGYRNLRSFPLLQHFYGLPYIDVRVSFNSFIPADIDDKLAQKLVDHYTNHLLAEPKLHDKVEFEIIFSCYTLDLPDRLKALTESGFSVSEVDQLQSKLKQLTNNIIHPEKGLWRDDLLKLEKLKSRRRQIYNSNNHILERIYWLIEDVKRYGTLPFAGLARAGFIAVQMLKSLVSVGVFSREDYDNFLSGIESVGSKISFDKANLDKNTFLKKYGHLRPGTYDILSPRYDETPEDYFDWSDSPLPSTGPDDKKPFSLTLSQMTRLKSLLKKHQLAIEPVDLLEFIQLAIEKREYAKFEFTRNLSDALSLISKYGERYKITKEDLAYCDIYVFQELYKSASSPEQLLQQSIAKGKSRHAETLRLKLPAIITSPDDIWSYHIAEAEPNYIGQKSITAKVSANPIADELSNKVVLIPNADPGYDWIFSHNIAALITAWGGANSHMAIRAGELSIPAVIGAGEKLFNQWLKASVLSIDCANQKVEVLR